MNDFNLYKDIKDSINKNFFLIKKYGFKTVEEKQLAYEYHFTTTNDKGDNISISFEAIYSSPIWVKINNVYFGKFFEDELLEKIENEINTLYKDNFDKYLKLDDEKYLDRNFENYRIKGRKLNNNKLNRIFVILGANLEPILIKSNH